MAERLEDWASASGAVVSEPSAQRIATGFESGQPLPAGQLNWILQRVPTWSTLEAAYAELAEGDLAIVHENDRTSNPGDNEDDGPADGADCSDIVCTGDRVVYVTAGVNDPKLVTRANVTAVVRTFTRTFAGTTLRLATNGIKLVAAYGNYVECWDLDTGASEWTYDHGGLVQDVCVWHDRVFFVGLIGTGTKYARAVWLDDGTLIWSFDHGGSLYACCANGGRLFVAGIASGHASLANLRAINALNGYDATGEGGVGTDVAYRSWNRVLATTTVGRRLACDHSALYIGFASGAANQIEVMSQGDAQIQIMTRALTGITVNRIAVDQDYVYLAAEDATPDGYLFALDRNTLTTAWVTEFLLRPYTTVATDGCAVFAGRGAIAGGEENFRRYARGNRPCLFRRYAGSSSYGRFPNPRSMVPEK